MIWARAKPIPYDVSPFLSIILYAEFLTSSKIYLIAVGKKDELGIEDIITAKIIKLTLLGKEIPNLNKIQQKIMKSPHAKLLKTLGFEDDVKFCSQLNTHQTVPLFSNKGFIKL